MFQKNLFLKQKSMNGTKIGFPICRINQKTIFLQKKRKKEKWKCNLKDMKSIRKNSHGYKEKTGSVSKKK